MYQLYISLLWMFSSPSCPLPPNPWQYGTRCLLNMKCSILSRVLFTCTVQDVSNQQRVRCSVLSVAAGRPTGPPPGDLCSGLQSVVELPPERSSPLHGPRHLWLLCNLNKWDLVPGQWSDVIKEYLSPFWWADHDHANIGNSGGFISSSSFPINR